MFSSVFDFILNILKFFSSVIIIEVIGAFIFWMLKGFKTKYTDELLRDGSRNFIVGSIIWTILVLVVWYMLYQRGIFNLELK